MFKIHKLIRNTRLWNLLSWSINIVGAESDQLVNIYRFTVRMWPSTQWHRVYTGSGNVPYVQFGSVGDFIPEPRCSNSVVGLQTRSRKVGCTRGPVGSGRKGRERRGLGYELSVQAGAWGPNLAVVWLWTIDLRNSDQLESVRPPCWRECIPFYRWRGWLYRWEGEGMDVTKPCCPHRWGQWWW